jgi:hypothetical protein
MTEMAGVEAEAAVRGGEKEPAWRGSVIIEWPPVPPYRRRGATLLPGWGCAIFDAETGRQILTVTGLGVRADAKGFVTCELTMFAGPDGNPLLELERREQHPVMPGHIGSHAVYPDDDGGIRTGTFPFLVAEMRVRQAAPPRAALTPKFTGPDTPEPAEP